MPELPEVETVRRGLEAAMDGEHITCVEVRRPDLRWPLAKDFAQRLKGKRVIGVGRRAKYLLVDLSSGDVLIMHLGMSGSFHVFLGKDKQPDKHLGRYYHERSKHLAHDHVVFHLASGASVMFNDPRRFGSMKLQEFDDPIPVTPTGIPRQPAPGRDVAESLRESHGWRIPRNQTNAKQNPE